MAKFLTRIFGSRNQRLLRQYSKVVKKINALEEGLQALSDDHFGIDPEARPGFRCRTHSDRVDPAARARSEGA